MKAVKRLQAKLERHSRVFDLLSARTWLRADWGFEAGIRTVSGLLQQDVVDETALLIYAENYVASRNGTALDDLIRFVLGLKTLSDSFHGDLGRILLDGRYPKRAARVLYAAKESGPELILLAAEAHYRADQIEQAGLKLARLADAPPTALTLEILAAYKAQRPETLQEAFKAANDVVYRLESRSPSAHLVLADVAFKLGNVAEGAKNVRKALALDPTSARVAMRALEVVNRHADIVGIDLREWIDDRRNVLDPAQRIARVVNTE